VPPVRAVLRERQPLRTVAEVLRRFQYWTARENGVVRFQEVLCGLGGGDDDDWHLTEAQGHDGPVLLGQGLERAVRELPQHVEVTDDREGRWAWRVSLVMFGAVSTQEDEGDNGYYYEGGKEEKRD